MRIRTVLFVVMFFWSAWAYTAHAMSPELFEKPDYIAAAKAIAEGDQTALDRLIAQGIDVNFESPETKTPWSMAKDTVTLLSWAIYSDKPHGMSTLLNAGADPNKTTHSGMTPLILASRLKNDGIFETLLVRYKANPNQIGHRQTALIVALEEAFFGRNKWERVEMLAKHGASINIDFYHGETPLIFSAIQHYFPAALWLLEHGANYEARDSTGSTMMCYLRGSYKANTLQPSELFDARDKVRDWLLAHGVARSRLDPALHPGEKCDD
jgi:uncharacterized protein